MNFRQHTQTDLFPVFFKLWFGFIFTCIVAGFIWNVMQYSRRPDCGNGVLIQDDAGVYRCLPANAPIILRGRR